MNINQIMKQAQQMQKKLQAEQEALKNTDFEGMAGNGAVKVVMNGEYNVKSVFIDKNVIDPEDKETLEDLIMVATNDCVAKIKKATESSMNSATGGIKLPF